MQTEGEFKEPQTWYHGNITAPGCIMTRTVVRVSPRFMWYYNTQWDFAQRKYVETNDIRRSAREGWYPLKGEAFHALDAELERGITYAEKALEEAKRKRVKLREEMDKLYKETSPKMVKDDCQSEGGYSE